MASIDSMGGINHSSSSMSMSFTNSHHTPLFAAAWTPLSPAAYAGTCIFLIILAIVGRALVAFKAVMERHWLASHLNRRYAVIANKNSEAGSISSDQEIKTVSLAGQSMTESVKVIHGISDDPFPWRFSVDVPRAILFLCIAGVSYLLYVSPSLQVFNSPLS